MGGEDMDVEVDKMQRIKIRNKKLRNMLRHILVYLVRNKTSDQILSQHLNTKLRIQHKRKKCRIDLFDQG